MEAASHTSVMISSTDPTIEPGPTAAIPTTYERSTLKLMAQCFHGIETAYEPKGTICSAPHGNDDHRHGNGDRPRID